MIKLHRFKVLLTPTEIILPENTSKLQKLQYDLKGIVEAGETKLDLRQQ